MGTVIYTQKGSESVATLKTNYLTDLCLIYRESQFYVMQIPSFYKKMASKYFQFHPQEKIIAYLHSSRQTSAIVKALKFRYRDND